MAKKPATNKPTMTRAEMRDFESRSYRRFQGTNKPKGTATLTQSERGGFETKSLKQSRVNPKATPKVTPKAPGLPATTGTRAPTMRQPPSPPGAGRGGRPPAAPRGGTSVVPRPVRAGAASRAERVIQGTAEVVRNRAIPGAAAQAARRGLGRLAAAAAGPVAGAVATGLAVGEILKGTKPAQAASEALTGLMAKVTGLEAEQNKMVLSTPQTRRTATAPGGTTPTVPSKTISEPPMAPTRRGGTAQTPKAAPAASQKPTRASSSRGRTMKGKELADFLGLGASSAVRTYMETGKHKYPSKK